jgi:signal transduction histidine kinase
MDFNLLSSRRQYYATHAVDGEFSSAAGCRVRTADQLAGCTLGTALAGVPKESGFPAATGFRVVVHGWERELKTGLREEIFGIVREAIINAFRHSRAKRIEAEIEYRSRELRIAVRDDGRGIDPQQLEWGRNGNTGLWWMRERAERAGARLRLLSRVAMGTEVELRVPLVD